MAVTRRRVLLFALLLVLAPLLYLIGFNSLGAAVPYNIDNFILAFMAQILVFLVFIGVFIVAAFVLRPLGARNGAIVSIVAALALLPLLLIYAFDLVLRVSVPYNIETYVLSLVLIVAITLISGLLEYAFA